MTGKPVAHLLEPAEVFHDYCPGGIPEGNGLGGVMAADHSARDHGHILHRHCGGFVQKASEVAFVDF
jgi:hypothetical protein